MHEVLGPVVAFRVQPEALDARKVIPNARVQDCADAFHVVLGTEVAQRFQDAADERRVVVRVRGRLLPGVEAEKGVELESDALPLCSMTRFQL